MFSFINIRTCQWRLNTVIRHHNLFLRLLFTCSVLYHVHFAFSWQLFRRFVRAYLVLSSRRLLAYSQFGVLLVHSSSSRHIHPFYPLCICKLTNCRWWNEKRNDAHSNAHQIRSTMAQRFWITFWSESCRLQFNAHWICTVERLYIIVGEFRSVILNFRVKWLWW